MAKKAITSKTAKPKATKSASTTPTVKDALAQLESMGNEAVRKQNAKWGGAGKQYGVKHGDIRILAKKIKTDHKLALSLWDTGIIDAQYLAILLMKPAELSATDVDRLVRSISFAWVAEWLHSYVVKLHADKETLRQMWMADADRWAARAGWQLTAGRIAKSPEGLDPVALLDRIEKEMGSAAPEVQWTMNACLAEIGINNPKLRKRAIAIGEKLGIYRDYPVSKGCTSPFAPIWIAEMVRRKGG